ncbi:MAG: DNA methyltransferase [Candidatus Binataceae bacterium]
MWSGATRAGEPDDTAKGRFRYHPTQKPTSLMSALIERWTEPGDLIFDPFCGGGPVPIAAAMTGRRAIACDIDREYCEIVARRIDMIMERHASA